VGFSTAGGNTPEALLVLALAYAGLPVLFKLAAMSLIWRFPLDEGAQRALRQRIEALGGPAPISPATTGGTP
jgi:glycoside/pentoside/hexuronide:cation symporter, GPH family